MNYSISSPFKGKNFYVAYGGNIGYFQNWDLVFDVARKLKNHDIYFVLFGEGSGKNTASRSNFIS